MNYKAFAPNGSPIVGTYETLKATALADIVKCDDQIEIEYMGESKVDWDSQAQDVDERGESLYVADDYYIIPEDKLVWKPYCPGCEDVKLEDELNDEGYCAKCALGV